MFENLFLLFTVLTAWLYLSYRMFKQYQFYRLKQSIELTDIVKRKMEAYEIILQKKQMVSLLIINFLMLISLLICVHAIFQLENTKIADHQQIVKLTQQLEEIQKKVK